jgi:hypothetical protein
MSVRAFVAVLVSTVAAIASAAEPGMGEAGGTLLQPSFPSAPAAYAVSAGNSEPNMALKQTQRMKVASRMHESWNTFQNHSRPCGLQLIL